jgi:hypothetical protein
MVQVAEFVRSDVGRHLVPDASPYCSVLQVAHASACSKRKGLNSISTIFLILFYHVPISTNNLEKWTLGDGLAKKHFSRAHTSCSHLLFQPYRYLDKINLKHSQNIAVIYT